MKKVKIYKPGDNHSAVNALEKKGYKEFTIEYRNAMNRIRGWFAIGNDLYIKGYSLENLLTKIDQLPPAP